MNQIFNIFNKTKSYLIVANILLTFFLILLNNLNILPLRMGDFLFFTFLTLAFALYRPGWAFLFFIGTIALENINLAPLELGMTLRPFQFIGALTALALIIRILVKRINFELPKLNWFDGLIGIMVISGFLSAFNAPDKNANLKLAVIIFSFGVLYLMTRIYIQTFADLKRIVPFFVSSSVTVMIYGIWQNIRFIYGGSNFEVMPGRPNATFTEADWLGIYLVLCLAIIYAIVYYCHSERSEGSNLESVKCKVQSAKLFFCFLYLVTCFLILILTVSRSAWLGAGFITILFLFIILTNLKFHPKNWEIKYFLRILLNLAGTIIGSILIIYTFHLTNFQLFNRAQSTGGLQKITISCDPNKLTWDINDYINAGNVVGQEKLDRLGCRHINLEEITIEKAKDFIVMEVYRQDPNVKTRQEIYQKSWNEIKKHPILGIGWGSIGQVLGNDERGSTLNSSNIFLEVWLGSGIIGLLSFVLIWIMILISGLRNFSKENSESKIYGIFLILGLFAILIPNLFNAGIMLGFLWVFWGISQNKTEIN